MAKLMGSVGSLIYSAVSTLLDNQVAPRLSTTMNDLVTTGFKVVEEVLKVARDLTAPDPAQPSQPEQGEQP